mgnify:CR=1 FL=1
MHSINDILNNIKTKKIELDNLLKSNLLLAYKLIFEQFPHIKSFSFVGYTPYFMDGDPCVFGLNGDIYKINGEVFEDWAESNPNWKEFTDLVIDVNNLFESEIQKLGEGEYIVSYINNNVNIKVEYYDHE